MEMLYRPAMQQEFNAQSTHAKGRTLIAGLYAAPAALLSVQNFGWMGFAVATAFIGALVYREKRQTAPLRFFKASQRSGRPDIALASRHSRLQTRTDHMAAVMGMPAVQAYWLGLFSRDIALSDGNDIGMQRAFQASLSDGELDFIIAHELDHSRAKSDHIWPNMFNAAANVMTGAYVADTFMRVIYPTTFQTGGAAPAGAPLYIGASMAVSFLSLQLAKRATSHAIEYRADSNALRAMADPESAASALEKINDYARGGWLPASPLPLRKRVMRYFTGTHPSLEQRQRNLAVTWRDMQREQRQKRCAAPSAP